MGAFSFLPGARLWAWARARPALLAALLLLGLYGWYLPSSWYYRFYYDSNHYWMYGQQFFKTGIFSLLSYTNSMRGFLFSLLLSPFSVACPHLGLQPIQLMRPLGMLTAAGFFGVMAPALWRAAQGPEAPAVSLGRRLLFGLVGFAVWRDYFNFPLTDFPALFALCLALWALLRTTRLPLAVLAGAALAASANMRPVFQAALPFAGALALLPPRVAGVSGSQLRWAGWPRLGAVLVGAALVLVPQFYINANNFGVRTPWVLAYKQGDPTNLFLQQLQWGLQYQKYETNVGDDYPVSQMFFLDHDGQALFDATRLPRFTERTQYLQLVGQYPVRVAGVWLRHLFNGLDVQYPGPYVVHVYERSWPMALLNYVVLLGGLVVLLRRLPRVRRHGRAVLVLAALLTPCLGALPVAMECRFLLPLAMVLSAAFAFGAHPWRFWRQAAGWLRAVSVLSFVLSVAAAFAFSASAQQTLEKGPRALFEWSDIEAYLPIEPEPVPAGEPW